jgi:ATP-dependent protease ClpP protease subunit
VFDDIRAAKLALLEVEIEAKTNEAAYSALKLEEAQREMAMARASFQEQNTLVFSNVIDNETVYQAMRTMEMYSRRSPGCDITIILDSPGGDIYSGFKLYDYLQEIRARGHKVTIKVIGAAQSHAVTVLQAADERVITENSFILIHEAQMSGLEGNYTQVFTQGKERMDKFHQKLLNILSGRSNLSKAQIKRRWVNKDWLLDAEEALKHGFVDTIQSPPSQG